MDFTMDELERLIDHTLDTLPVEPLPPGFTPKLIARISRRKPGFRLEFTDIAVPVFLAIFGILLVFCLFWIYSTIDPIWFMRLQLEWQLLRLRVMALPNLNTLVPGLLVGVGTGLVLLLGVVAWLTQGSGKFPVLASTSKAIDRFSP
jgi:hypothetical protein